jgi:hypothetical protein
VFKAEMQFPLSGMKYNFCLALAHFQQPRIPIIGTGSAGLDYCSNEHVIP